MRRARMVIVACLIMVCLISCQGCLSGSYDVAHTTSLDRYRQDVTMHREPKQFAKGRLEMRVPKLFSSEKAPKPAFLKDLDGFAVALEGLRDVAEKNGEKMPVGLAVWCATDGASSLEDVKSKISGMVRSQKHPAFADAAWTDVKEPAGGPPSWAVMTLAGQQPFDRLSAGEKGGRETKNTGGKTQIWVASDAERKVCAVLVWSVPEELAGSVPLDDYARFVARTVKMNPGVEAEPDAAEAAANKPAGDKPAGDKPAADKPKK